MMERHSLMRTAKDTPASRYGERLTSPSCRGDFISKFDMLGNLGACLGYGALGVSIAMEWSDLPPQTPGVYLWECHGRFEVMVAYKNQMGVIEIGGSCWRFPVSEWDGWWLGPLPDVPSPWIFLRKSTDHTDPMRTVSDRVPQSVLRDQMSDDSEE